MRTIALACASLIAVSSIGRAQSTQATQSTQAATPGQLPIVPGMRVRVSASNLVAPLVANYLGNSADTLKFVEGRGVWSLTLDQITKLEVTVGEQKRNGNYILRDGAIGAGAGAVIFGFYAANRRPSDRTKDYSLAANAGLGFLVGGAIGAYIGSRESAERWRPLPLPKKLTVAPDLFGRWHVGASLSF